MGKGSEGRLKVEVYPSQALAKAPAQCGAAENRIMDVTVAVLGFSASRFPLSQMVELPGLAKTPSMGRAFFRSCMTKDCSPANLKIPVQFSRSPMVPA